MSRLIYFIRPVGQQGPIKIGSSYAPEKRIRKFATWSPFPLEFIALIPGTVKEEHFLHRCFADQHLHREWFAWSPELQNAIEIAIAANSVDHLRQFLTPRSDVSPARPQRGRYSGPKIVYTGRPQ